MSRGLTFKSGIHPLAKIHHGKPLSENCSVEEMPASEIVRIPLSMHIGAPATALVSEGDTVKVGQKIGESNGFVSVPCHSSVSGTVLKIENIPGIMGKMIPAVIIKNDFLDTKEEISFDYENMQPDDIKNAIKDAGIVGMGGATFPLHVKLSPPADKKIDCLILNGAECEPFLTADHRLMLEYANEIVIGTKILLRAIGINKAYIGIEDNKQNAIATMKKAAENSPLEVCELKTKYPQGSEKQLIDSITGRQVPSGALPADVGVIVANVASVKAVHDLFIKGEPLTKRIVTVTGSVGTPKNLMVRIGTKFEDVIEYAGGIKGEAMKIISGGPMMGLPVPSLDCSVVKGTSGILVLGKEYMPKKERKTACIQCGRCAQGCPIHLLPMRIAACAEKEMFDEAEKFNAVDCLNCGSCSYVCPAKRDVSQYIKLAKDQILRKRAEERRKKEQENK